MSGDEMRGERRGGTRGEERRGRQGALRWACGSWRLTYLHLISSVALVYTRKGSEWAVNGQ